MALTQGKTVILMTVWIIINLIWVANAVFSGFAAQAVLLISCRKDASDFQYELLQGNLSISKAFVLGWQILLAVLLSVLGGLILLKYQSPLSLGFLSGMSFIMANWMLCSAIEAGDKALRYAFGDETLQKDGPLFLDVHASLAVLLSLLYGTFSAFVLLWKYELLKLSYIKDEGEDDEVSTLTSRHIQLT